MLHFECIAKCRVHTLLYGQLVALGHCVSVLLQQASSSTSNDLRRASLRALCALAGLDATSILEAARLHPAPAGSSELAAAIDTYLSLMSGRVGVMEGERRKALASFLPGVCSGVTRLLTADAKTVESVVSLGLLTWAHYVGVALIEDGEEEEESPGEEQGRERKPVLVRQTESWLQETAERLKLLMERMCVLVTSDVWRVRLVLVGWAHSLLQHCSQ